MIEADEYDGMFLGLELEVGVVTNVEWDHVDCYPTPAAFDEAFRKFVGQIPPEGMLVVCADDPGALDLRDAVVEGVKVETYGLADEAAWQARSLSQNAQGGFDAEVWHDGEHVADLSLPVPGRHNVRNALAALAVANWHHIRPRLAVKMLHDFHGAGRRFEFIGEAGGVIVIDDYAHHPTEVAATLSAARLRYPTRRIWAVFQPHTYSRTQALLQDYEHSFDDADRVLLLDIYAAREKIDLGMHSRQLLEVMEHEGAVYVGTIEAAVETLLSERRAGRCGDHDERGRREPGGHAAALRAAPARGARVGQRGNGTEMGVTFEERVRSLGVQLLRDEPLAKHTTFRIGGPADWYAAATTLEQLEALPELALDHGIPVTVLGGGSNMLVSDAGIRGSGGREPGALAGLGRRVPEALEPSCRPR